MQMYMQKLSIASKPLKIDLKSILDSLSPTPPIVINTPDAVALADMRPSALETLYRDLELKYGYQERNLPSSFVIRPLHVEDSEEVAALEAKCFPASEAASLEKVKYRLTVAPELSAGIYQREYDWASPSEDFAGVTSTESRLTKETLIGYIVATKTDKRNNIDEAMELGSHKEAGNIICIHSVATDEKFRGQGLANIVLKDYVQRLFSLHTADGIEIIAHKKLVPFYEKHGFKDEGASKSPFGNGGWNDMWLGFDLYDNEQ